MLDWKLVTASMFKNVKETMCLVGYFSN